MMRATFVLLAALGLVLAAPACSKSGKKRKAEDPLRVNPTERDRGLRACKAYVERACRCAKTKFAFKKPCEEAEAHKVTLDMVFSTIVSDQVNNPERVRLIKSARKTIETCFSTTAQMDPRVCPAK